MKTMAVVVEGHGEVHAVPVLLRRIAAELGHVVKVTRPVRIRRNRVERAGELERAVELAFRDAGKTGSILVLLDAERDCPAQLALALASRAEAVRPDGMVRVVLAKTEFECWFLAAAASIGGRRGIAGCVAAPAGGRPVSNSTVVAYDLTLGRLCRHEELNAQTDQRHTFGQARGQDVSPWP